MKSLFEEIKESGIPYLNHETDLYVPDTLEVREILARHPLENGNRTTFINQVEGGLWFDIPFAYLPAWDAKVRKLVWTLEKTTE